MSSKMKATLLIAGALTAFQVLAARTDYSTPDDVKASSPGNYCVQLLNASKTPVASKQVPGQLDTRAEIVASQFLNTYDQDKNSGSRMTAYPLVAVEEHPCVEPTINGEDAGI